MKKTTFVRKGASLQRQLPAGTKPSVHNGQLLVSSGLHDLDGIIGGGFPLGSLVLIEEDRYSEYCQNLMRYFLSEGVTNKHSVACGIFNQQPTVPNAPSSTLLPPSLSSYFAFNYSRFKQEQELKEQEKEATTSNTTPSTTNIPKTTTTTEEQTKPATNSIMDRLNRKMGATNPTGSGSTAPSSGLSTAQTSSDSNDSELKIAWRYQDFVEQQIKAKQQRGTSSSASGEKSGVIGTVLCSEYDLSKIMQEELIKDNLDGIHLLFDRDEIFEGDNEEIKVFYDDLLIKIAKIITDSKKHFSSSVTTNEISSRAVVRIGLQSLGSLFYNCGPSSHGKHMLKFLLQLKSLLRSSLSVCVCTVPKAALQMMSPSLVQQLEQLSDLSMSIDSFTGASLDVSEWEFKEYSGLFYIKKLFKMNSLTYNFTPETLNYAFKIKKRKMYIEKLHLPPEETREASNPDRPKFKASNDVERHKLKVNKVLKEVPSANPQNDMSLQQADDHVFGCASQSSVTGSNPLDF